MIGRALSSVFAGLMLAFGSTTQARAADTTAPDAVPASWLAYAQVVSQSLNAWLSGKEEAALRLRTYLHAMPASNDASAPRVSLKLWIDDRGVITRIDFAPFVHDQANTDLRTLLIDRSLPESPPSGLLLPLRLELQLEESVEA